MMQPRDKGNNPLENWNKSGQELGRDEPDQQCFRCQAFDW